MIKSNKDDRLKAVLVTRGLPDVAQIAPSGRHITSGVSPADCLQIVESPPTPFPEPPASRPGIANHHSSVVGDDTGDVYAALGSASDRNLR